MGAPIGNKNAAGKRGKNSKFGRVGSKSWTKKVDADYKKWKAAGGFKKSTRGKGRPSKASKRKSARLRYI